MDFLGKHSALNPASCPRTDKAEQIMSRASFRRRQAITGGTRTVRDCFDRFPTGLPNTGIPQAPGTGTRPGLGRLRQAAVPGFPPSLREPLQIPLRNRNRRQLHPRLQREDATGSGAPDETSGDGNERNRSPVSITAPLRHLRGIPAKRPGCSRQSHPVHGAVVREPTGQASRGSLSSADPLPSRPSQDSSPDGHPFRRTTGRCVVTASSRPGTP